MTLYAEFCIYISSNQEATCGEKCPIDGERLCLTQKPDYTLSDLAPV